MAETNFKEISDFISNELRLKTFPVAVKFLKTKTDFPDKTRQLVIDVSGFAEKRDDLPGRYSGKSLRLDCRSHQGRLDLRTGNDCFWLQWLW